MEAHVSVCFELYSLSERGHRLPTTAPQAGLQNSYSRAERLSFNSRASASERTPLLHGQERRAAHSEAQRCTPRAGCNAQRRQGRGTTRQARVGSRMTQQRGAAAATATSIGSRMTSEERLRGEPRLLLRPAASGAAGAGWGQWELT